MGEYRWGLQRSARLVRLVTVILKEIELVTFEALILARFFC